jgi:hypothetical protein
VQSLFALAAVLLALGMVTVEFVAAPEEPGVRVEAADESDTPRG